MKTSPPPRRAPWLMILFLCAGPSGLLHAEDEIEKAFRDALYAEEVKGDSETALKAYQEVSAKFEMQRDMAATAIFRQGECLRKLGRKEEAAAAYNKVLSQYGDRERVANLCRENLTALGLPSPAAPVPGTEIPGPADEEAREIARLTVLQKNSPDLLNAGELWSAAESGKTGVVAWLLKQLPGLPPAEATSALQVACQKGHLKIAEALLDAGARPDGTGGDSPLWSAFLENRIEVVKLLLSRKVNPDARWQMRVNNDPFSGDPRELEEATPLVASVFKTDTPPVVIDLLIGAGADVNATAKLRNPNTRQSSSVVSITALGVAIRRWDAGLVRTLLAAKANPDQPARDGEPPLLLAARNLWRADSPEKEEILRILLDAGADWKGTNTDGQTFLHVCAEGDRPLWLEKGIKAGLDVNAPSKAGLTPLDQAALTGSVECVRILLAAGAKVDPERKPEHAFSPLSFALTSRTKSEPVLRILTMLLDAGADPNRPLEKGGRVLNLLSDGWHSDFIWPEAIQLLVTRGARPGESSLFNPGSLGSKQPGVTPSIRETFKAVWKAAHWRDNPRLSQAVWVSQGESMLENRLTPRFSAVYCRESALTGPPTLRTFLRDALYLNLLPDGFISELSGVSIIRIRDGKEQISPVDVAALLTEEGNKDLPLEWGDVVELPTTSGGDHMENQNRVNLLMAGGRVETRIQPAKGRFLVNTGSPDHNFHMDEESFDLSTALRLAGVSGLLFDNTRIHTTAPDGMPAKRTMLQDDMFSRSPRVERLRNGDILEMLPGTSLDKLSNEKARTGIWLCHSMDGPFWPVNRGETVNHKPLPMAALVLALLGPHPLPSACFDWEKALVRTFDINDGAEWKERKLLEAWPSLNMEPGTVIVLPPAERDHFEPSPELRKALNDALSTDWTLSVGTRGIQCRYEPRYFRGDKTDAGWTWRDLETNKSTGPAFPVLRDLIATQPAAAHVSIGGGGNAVSYPTGGGRYREKFSEETGGAWIVGSGISIETPPPPVKSGKAPR